LVLGGDWLDDEGYTEWLQTLSSQTTEQNKFITRKFEFEIEVLVRAAWSGFEIVHVPGAGFFMQRKENAFPISGPLKTFHGSAY
jgi:hypothetical protein